MVTKKLAMDTKNFAMDTKNFAMDTKKFQDENGSISVEAMIVFPIFILIIFALINVVLQATAIIKIEKSAADTLMLCNEKYYICKKIGRAVNDSIESQSIISAIKTIDKFTGENFERLLERLSEENGSWDLSGENVFKSSTSFLLNFVAKGYVNKFVGKDTTRIKTKTEINLVEADQDKENKDYEIRLSVTFEPDIIKTPIFKVGVSETTFFTRGWGNETEKLVIETPKKNEDTGITVYVTRTGACYHKRSCHNSLDESCIPILLEAAKISGYRSCKLCKP